MRKILLRLIAVTVLFAVSSGVLSSCKKEAEPERKSKVYYEYFDTVTTIYDFSGGSSATFNANADAFREELAICHRLFDIYNSYEGVVNLKTINDNAGRGPVSADARIIELLTFSKEMHQKTDGLVNVAMGAVLKIWHGYRTEGVRVPTEEELRAAAEHCNIDDLIIDSAKGTVELRDPEMSLDVGAVAKGFAIDRAAELLRARGAVSYAIDVGGNLYAIGTKADGSKFNTGVTNPDGGDYSAYIAVADGAVATSGDYERFYTVNGVRYHHIISPTSLKPEGYYRSVTVYSHSAAVSDALSTALFNAPSYEVARAIVARVGGVRQLVFVEKGGRVERLAF